MRQSPPQVNGQAFQIVNITNEVIRDYLDLSVPGEPSPPNVDLSPPIQQCDVKKSQDVLPTPPSLQDEEPMSEVLPHVTNAPTQLPVLSIDGLEHSFLDSEFFFSPEFSDSAFEDGIFLPGSEYQELHATLRSRIIDTARSTAPTRLNSPEPVDVGDFTEQIPDPVAHGFVDEESRRLAQLVPEQEYFLLQNYISEVAGWVDKFDHERNFELTLPVLAKTHSHLKYAILALSARQIERKQQQQDFSCSLALYSHAIHLLSPLLQTRTTAVLASCVVLCVLEMLSCSPKAWRRHLDGCAALIQSLGLNGACSGLEGALFWIFARMDICGALISSERTLIPMHRWLGGDLRSDVAALKQHRGADMYANHVVYLCGQMVDLFCRSGKWEQRHRRRTTLADGMNYDREWQELFELVEGWCEARSEEMKPMITIPATGQDPDKPFPTLYYGNGAATSGNQLYHTAALLMLKFKPAHLHFARKPRSILWHARQICAISISNDHHGCWTNATQPLWIAGQQMSHPSEHRAIIQIYERIERETGWGTKWRADDLLAYWGDTDV